MDLKQKLSDFIQLEQGSGHAPKLVGLGTSILAGLAISAVAHAHEDGHGNTHSNGHIDKAAPQQMT